MGFRKPALTVRIYQAGFKALVEENVKQNVDRIKKQSILATVSSLLGRTFHMVNL